MGNPLSTKRRASVGHKLRMEPFHALANELLEWRVVPDTEQVYAGKGGGIILPFVKGLRLSARLIYIIREALPSGYQVDWGHLLTPDEQSCSPECDIIIHRNGCVRRWNGNEKPVMDFKFINCKNALSVISCKSFVQAVDREYCRHLQPYISSVFLFGECCRQKDARRLTKAALDAGYRGFWYLLTMDQKGEYLRDEEVWEGFLNSVLRFHRTGRDSS